MIDLFLIILALVYLICASLSDLRKREVPNWLSFSLIAFALVYRGFFALYNLDLWFFLFGLLGILIFVGLGYAFYYARIFAGGDAKLLMALGAVLPSSDLYSSLLISLAFIFMLLVSGSVWGIIWSSALVMKNRKEFWKEFKKTRRKYRNYEYLAVAGAIILLVLPIISGELLLIAFPVIILIFPFLFAYAKAIENSCMIRVISSAKLTEGDWLYEKVKAGGKTIKPYWEGLSLEEIKLLRKYRKNVKIKEGIPFVPAFLFAFLALIYLLYFRVDVLNLFF